MINRVFRTTLFTAVVVAAFHAAATTAHESAGEAAASEPDPVPTCQRGLDAPVSAPSTGYGPACSYELARGLKDGKDGYFIVTTLFEYANGVLINVRSFDRFVPDGKFGPQPERESSAGS